MNVIKKLGRFAVLSSLTIAMLSMAACSPKTTGYHGEDISGQVSVIRDKSTKQAKLSVGTGMPWKLYAGSTPEGIDMSKAVLDGSENGIFDIPVSDTERSYFQFESDGSGALIAERQLPIEGGFNFRDMGGYRTKDGRFVKWGKLFRTDDMNKLTDSDMHYLSSTGLKSVVDFRTESEVEEAPDKLPGSVENHYLYAISPGQMIGFEALARMTTEEIEDIMVKMNVLFMSDSVIIKTYRDFFALLQDETKLPLSFHCSAGKDRTGMAAVLILYALGVDEDTIMEDYMLSNNFLVLKYKDIVAKFPTLKPLFEVRPEFLNAGLKYAKERYGSIENFLVNELGVNIEKFREMYLY